LLRRREERAFAWLLGRRRVLAESRVWLGVEAHCQCGQANPEGEVGELQGEEAMASLLGGQMK